MAWATGTAANHLDLVAKLRDFLTSNADLVALGQNWTQLLGPTGGTPIGSDEFLFQGPGLAGDDEVLIALRIHENPGLARYSIYTNGLTGYNPTLPIASQIGLGPAGGRMLLANLPMTYWFIASGRCFKVVAKVGSVYDQAYNGLILPEHMPADWSYPLFVGGSHNTVNADNSDVSHQRGAFWTPHVGAAYLLNPMLTWRDVANYSGGSSSRSSTTSYINVLPWSRIINQMSMRGTIDNLPVLTQGLLATETTTDGANGTTYGRFEGVFHINSFNVLAEQIVTIDGADYLVIPDTFRTGDGYMAAYALQ